MLGAGEILAPDDRRLRVALWDTSRSLDNLRRGSELVVCVMVPGPYYLRCRPMQLWPIHDDATAVETVVVSVLSDRHAGYRVVAGVRVEADEALSAVLSESSLAALAALRKGPPERFDTVAIDVKEQ
jgi:hypothetical protein